jgi:malonate transporter and related proteins
MDKLRAALLGYTFASTAVPIYGLTVLVPIYGEQIGTGIVGLAALITNLTQVSIAVFLLQSAAANSVAAKSVMGAST